jgi:hypothetical protein
MTIYVPGKVTLLGGVAMSWIITGSFAQPDEPEALAYIAAVEAADGQALEDGVKFAYNSFIKGCKADGIWNAIKASCILAGARTLAGALVPLVGTAPTNYNFVAGDYDRETGLVGDGSTKYLDSNRNNNADPQNDKHLSSYINSFSSINGSIYVGAGIGGVTGQAGMANNLAKTNFRVNNGPTAATPNQATGFIGCSRSISASFAYRNNGTSFNSNYVSETPINENIGILGRVVNTNHSEARLSFYSIGESLDLALLDSRITTLMSDLAAAIP